MLHFQPVSNHFEDDLHCERKPLHVTTKSTFFCCQQRYNEDTGKSIKNALCGMQTRVEVILNSKKIKPIALPLSSYAGLKAGS